MVPEEKSPSAPLALHLVLATAWLILLVTTNMATTWHIGLVSDDYDFIARAPGLWLQPFDTIHWSPVLHRMFAWIAAGAISPQLAHVGVTLLHGLVCLAFCWLLRRGLGLGVWASWLGAMLWATTPAAAESVFWLCASGNVGVCLALMLALGLAFLPGVITWRQGAGLALLQAVACLWWDIGALILPAVLLVKGMVQPRMLRASLQALAPVACVWLAYQGIRWHMAVPVGYGLLVEGPLRAVKDLIIAPGIIFGVDFPQAVRVILSAACWGAMLVGARQSRMVAALVAAFVLLQLPSMLFGVLQARYLYMCGPLFYAAMLKIGHDLRLSAPPEQQPWRGLAMATTWAFVALLQTNSYELRSAAWRDASLRAKALARDIQRAVQAHGYEQVVLRHVPDSFGDPQSKWRPFVWRRGLVTQVPQAVRICLDASVEPCEAEGMPVIDIASSGDARKPRYTLEVQAASVLRSTRG